MTLVSNIIMINPNGVQIYDRNIIDKFKTETIKDICTNVRESVHQSVAVLLYLDKFTTDKEHHMISNSVSTLTALSSYVQNCMSYVGVLESGCGSVSEGYTKSSLNLLGTSLFSELSKTFDLAKGLTAGDDDVNVVYENLVNMSMLVTFDFEHFHNIIMHMVSKIISNGHKGILSLKVWVDQDNVLMCTLDPIGLIEFEKDLLITKSIATCLGWSCVFIDYGIRICIPMTTYKLES